MDIQPKYARQQGAEARELTDDDSNSHFFSAHDCPYGPGELRDAWIAGFGGAKEEQKQVDTSPPTTSDVRIEEAETVRKGSGKGTKGKGRGKKGAKDKGDNSVATSVQTTGTGETALETHVEMANPEEAGVAPRETVIGDPAREEGVTPDAIPPEDRELM